MNCSGEKTKFLICGTRAMRQNRIKNENIQPKIKVCEDEIKESSSEKLLGVIVNNTLSWKHHLHGNEEEDGLIKNLSNRVNMLKRLRKFLPNPQFNSIVSGLFLSKLSYCLTVWGSVWNIPGDMTESGMKTNMSKNDLRKLQVLHNKCMRLQTGKDRNTSCATLLSLTNSLSVHQMIAHKSAIQVYNISKNQAPKYHFDRLFPSNNSRVEFSRTIGRGTFFYQGSRLWSALPLNIKMARNTLTFKKQTKIWIKNNIVDKP